MAKEFASKGDSDSPLATRRGNADPVDVDDTPLNLGFSELHDYDNTLEPHGPQEPGTAKPPSDTFPEPHGPPGDRSPTPPKEPGSAGTGITDGERADLAFKGLGK
jgi:hypothetical protein